ncbi:metallophosphoesterase family protein [Actinotalea solisilvae]|uniref:metallophosphoesterase family protein n=1 Tax=Actinotalea solisilvae TaxID=2072922 RepID=UPI001F216A57|nr:metallophosphoesterase [Actinotalea solisilvae]
MTTEPPQTQPPQTQPPRTGTRAPRSRTRRVLRWFGLLLALLVPSAAWGVATASAEATLGPHLARYEVTVDGDVTIDLGPLGTLVTDSPLPLALGARVVVHEIPREVTSVEPADTLEALGGDLRGYVQFFSAPGAAIETAVERLVLDAARRAALAMVALALGSWLVRAALGPARRGELLETARPYTGVAAGATAVAMLVTGTLTASGERALDDTTSAAASRVFDGTPLEGARITGRLAGVIDTYGGYVVDAYRENEAFYDGATATLREAWAEREESDVALAAAREALLGTDGAPAPSATDPAPGETAGPPPTPSAVATGGAADEDPADEPADEGPADDGTAPAGPTVAPDREREDAPEPVVLLVVSDLHCNVGMARVIRAAAELSGAQVVVNAGDTTVNGTAVEEYCVEAFVDAVPGDAVMVVADGNHDSEQTSAQERRAGARVLDGEVVEVGGLRILGDSDPNATRIGVGTVPVGEESIGAAARRLADVACADEEGVDLLLVHNPNVGNLALEEGCAPAQVSGHQHRRIGPVRFGEGVRYVSSSTAGAALGQATIGPLNGVAEMTVLRWDPATRSVLDQRLVRVMPTGEVQVGFAVAWPVADDVDAPRAGAR